MLSICCARASVWPQGEQLSNSEVCKKILAHAQEEVLGEKSADAGWLTSLRVQVRPAPPARRPAGVARGCHVRLCAPDPPNARLVLHAAATSG
eukprot:3631502-Prymnesium_polylepis.2